MDSKLDHENKLHACKLHPHSSSPFLLSSLPHSILPEEKKSLTRRPNLNRSLTNLIPIRTQRSPLTLHITLHHSATSIRVRIRIEFLEEPIDGIAASEV